MLKTKHITETYPNNGPFAVSLASLYAETIYVSLLVSFWGSKKEGRLMLKV